MKTLGSNGDSTTNHFQTVLVCLPTMFALWELNTDSLNYILFTRVSHPPTTLIRSASNSTGCFLLGLCFRQPVTSTALPNVSRLEIKTTELPEDDTVKTHIHTNTYRLNTLTHHWAQSWRLSAVAADSFHRSHAQTSCPFETWRTEPNPWNWTKQQSH